MPDRRLRSGRTADAAAVATLLMDACLFALFAGCANAAPQKPTDPCGKGVEVVVQETAGIARASGLVECGIPLARGKLSPGTGVTVCDQGERIPVRWEPLAYWPDGSVRWAKVAFFLPMEAGQKKVLTLTESGPDKAAPAHLPPDLPDITLTVTTDTGVHEFKVLDGQSLQEGEFFVETDVEPLSGDLVRVRTHVGQLQRDASWKDLSVVVAADGKAVVDQERGAIRMGQWTAAVRDAVARGPVTVAAGAKGMTLSLYPGAKMPPYPADEGFHVSHEIILERNADPTDLARRVDAPLRAVFTPQYAAETRAAGIVCPAGKEASGLDGALQASLARIRKQMEEPVNRGWTAWGDLAADEGNAYMGYYNQEYDPAAALYQYYLHAGDLQAFELANAMARQYADNSVNLQGGVYQHRSTSWALLGTIGDCAAAALIEHWRGGSDRPASDQRILQGVSALYTKEYDPKQRVRALFTKRLKDLTAARVTDQAERERLAASYGGYTLAEAAMDDFKRGDKGILKRVSAADPGIVQRNKGSKKDPNPHDLAVLYRASKGLIPLDKDIPATVDEIFRPFFARYGGSWQDFPRLHFYDAPDVDLTHHGSHTLVEMLVWGHFLTGDEHLRRMALRVAQDFAAPGGLADRATDRIAEMRAGKGLVHVRTGGWTLVNLLALLDLTQTAEPELHAALQQKTQRLLKEIVAIEPDRYEGVIHAGITTEAMARYHWQYGDQDPRTAKQVLDRLIQIVTLYSREQWSDADKEFYYRVDNHKMTLEYGSYLIMLGLAYGAENTTDPAVESLLTQRLQALVAGAAEPTDTTKGLGMKFRCSYRALGVMAEPQAGRRR